MAEWIDIPAHRVYVVTGIELRGDFELINAQGQLCREGEIYAMVRRKKDARLFRRAREFGGQIKFSAGSWDGVVLEEV